MKRRSFLKGLCALVAGVSLAPKKAGARLLESPVKTNRLRPPGAVAEADFPAKCIRCGRCVEVCPYRSIIMLDLQAGVHAGTPLIKVDSIPCYLCMKCVDVCPTGSLQPVAQKDTRMGLAIIDTFSCYAWQGQTLCRTCYDKCPFAERAIKLDQLKPVVVTEHCTGCGLCTNACPVTLKNGKKAINIEPIYAQESH